VSGSKLKNSNIFRNEELAQKNLQIDILKKQQHELEQKYKESVQHYENWKHEVETEFGKQLGQRESQIKDLKYVIHHHY
jgi:hypothetical protein